MRQNIHLKIIIQPFALKNVRREMAGVLFPNEANYPNYQTKVLLKLLLKSNKRS